MNVGDNWRGWTIEELLGEGAFGQVFKIVRHEMGHDYYSALKVIHVPQGKSEYNALENQGMSEREIEVYLQDIVHDFSRELSVMDELKGNSNIVSYENHLIEQSPDGKSWTIYIRMELLTPLLKFYKYNYPDEEEIIKLGLDICSALEVCRLNKIIHRDIKPANIFVAKFGDYKLGDFGIARKLENTKSGLSKKGTYTYMAPEVYLGKPYNHTVDIYSLGIVLYILLNDSRAPFVPAPPEIPRYNEYDSALQRRMRGEALPPPRNASPELAKVVLKACAYDSRERYQTPTELKKALLSIDLTRKQAYLKQINDNQNKSKKRTGLFVTIAALSALVIVLLIMLVAYIEISSRDSYSGVTELQNTTDSIVTTEEITTEEITTEEITTEPETTSDYYDNLWDKLFAW